MFRPFRLAQKPAPGLSPDREGLLRLYRAVRTQTEALSATLSPEDQQIQSMPDASPAKWHRAHCTWFFETLVLAAHEKDHAPFDPAYGALFNSYYEALGARHPRPERGVLSRPSCAEIARYRGHVDMRLERFISDASEDALAAAAPMITLGCHHEQQHQELLLMDIKHAFSRNALYPAFVAGAGTRGRAPAAAASPARMIGFPGGDHHIGYDGDGFAYDNEKPRHEVKLLPYALGSRLITNGEWRAFIADGGYRKPELWLSDGWACAQAEGWTAPLYWIGEDKRFTLQGLVDIDDAAPVCHVSFYEADAYARWKGSRLPLEGEWEAAARHVSTGGNFMEAAVYDPLPAKSSVRLAQMFGDLWEWTASPYVAYPGFRPFAGAAGEYNGKFMVNQLVLRGGACVTPASHIRSSYRNFFYPHMRWLFSGVRLAEDR